jgi:signal transduction histidine kinase
MSVGVAAQPPVEATREAGIESGNEGPVAETLEGVSGELKGFSAGIRAISALMCTVLLIAAEPHMRPSAQAALLVYDLFACSVLWRKASGRSMRLALGEYWVDVVWTLAVLHLTSAGTGMMVITLVQPVVLASICFGVRQGVVLASFAAIGMVVDIESGAWSLMHGNAVDAVAALAVIALVPVAAVLSRPMSVLRQRLMLVREIEERLDPRRGLDSIGATMVDALRVGIGADVAALVLPTNNRSPAFISTQEDGAFRAADDAHRRIERSLDRLPRCPTSHVVRRWYDLFAGTRVHGSCRLVPAHSEALHEIAKTLEVRMVIVVPFMRYEKRHGHLVVGLRTPRVRMQEVSALADAAPELFRVIEQAALVDRLQDESAAHERARIGRDLHDSAIQPYLGLKFAVEGVAQRVEFDNPARAEIDALLGLVNSEVSALREMISGLRDGEMRGDNALLPAVKRQVRRFALLFGIDVQLDCPSELPMSRALAGALFHMVNEAMNNVRKHSPAKSVSISLGRVDDWVELRVRDDAGTVMGQPQADFMPRSLQERTEALGGTLVLQRPDGRNTELLIRVPMAGTV